MHSKIEIEIESKEPLYKQLVKSIEYLVDSGEYRSGDYVPSLNDLSSELNISKETVKKAYSLLRKKNLLESAQGKGYYISESKINKLNILLIFDRLGTYKQAMFDSFSEKLGNNVEISIRLHNQDISTFERFLDDGLDNYDYYVITPHFPLIEEVQKRVVHSLGKIPNRKLLLLDHHIEGLSGNFGSVYQNYEHDVYHGLQQGVETLKKYKKLNVISLKGSLYAPFLQKGIAKFCSDNSIDYEILYQATPEDIKKNQVYLILNGQLDKELIELAKTAISKDYNIGSDIGIISYNESPINEMILNGLTVLSTDFYQMGEVAANMILNKSFKKIKCDFRLVRRSSF
ncbi:GntR family transcriptional regulator [Zobellia alginiliquefaciens]|uniref:GntR family transcriptional regulator n=1 Tax=Zobellia alginiliquefaciens TaxID=3032586 RepID=UPI0023E39442|nr:GntR family transcriptional regulator [Zobellia alginiliquefaciens]